MRRPDFLFFATFFLVAASAFAQDAAPLPGETPAQPSPLDYQKPDVSKQVGASYSATKEVTQISLKTGADVSRWWSQINDPVLEQLTREAVSNNLTLQEALFNIQAARAVLGKEIQKLERLPANATSTERELAERRCEAANAELEVQRWLYRGAYVDLVADVAETYIVARSTQELIRNAMWNVKLQELAQEFVASNASAGLSSSLDVVRARNVSHVAAASLDALQTQYRQALNRLSVLVGQAPGHVDNLMFLSNDDLRTLNSRELNEILENLWRELAQIEGRPRAQATQNDASDDVEEKRLAFISSWLEAILPTLTPKTPEEILIGVPADLLRRRPDICAAEQRVVAQNARVAIAALEARLAAEKSSSDASTDDNFDAEAARFEREAAIARYRALILEAQCEVNDALALYSGRSPKSKARCDALELTLQARLAANARRNDLGALFDPQRQLFESGAQFIENATQRVLAVVALYRALGGDWDAPSPELVEATQPVEDNATEAE